MNRLTFAVLIALALPTTASAAALEELPFEQRNTAAGCLQATGAPGGLATLGTYSGTDSTTELRTVGGGTESVSVGRLIDCATVAEAPGGAAIVAGVAVSRGDREYKAELRARLRGPGGAFGDVVALHDGFSTPVTAIAPSGAALVAWATYDESGGEGAPRSLMVARRAPGGAFGAPETVATWPIGNDNELLLRAAIDAAGNATLLVVRELETESARRRLEIATAAPGAPFALQRLATTPWFDSPPTLAVAPDGWALVTHRNRRDRRLPKVYERAPGAASFTPVALPAGLPVEDWWSFSDPTVAIRSGGGAIVAWRTGPFESQSGVDAMTRESAGAFTARRVARPVPLKDFGDDVDDDIFALDALDPLGAPPLGYESAGLEAALAADGRVVLAWPAPAGRRPLAVQTVRAAVGGLGGTFEPARTLGSPMREAGDVAALFTADGSRRRRLVGQRGRPASRPPPRRARRRHSAGAAGAAARDRPRRGRSAALSVRALAPPRPLRGGLRSPHHRHRPERLGRRPRRHSAAGHAHDPRRHS